MDYFTKWAEAEALITIIGRNILKFFWKNVICRFGILPKLSPDNGKQFAEDPFKSWCSGWNITQDFTSMAHPQANGQVKITKRTIVQGLKSRLDLVRGDWVKNLPYVL